MIFYLTSVYLISDSSLDWESCCRGTPQDWDTMHPVLVTAWNTKNALRKPVTISLYQMAITARKIPKENATQRMVCQFEKIVVLLIDFIPINTVLM
tara:strand:+ start:94347 stop:94634 length:288 start_codon:yes stop_codon:yes gene_type:complete